MIVPFNIATSYVNKSSICFIVLPLFGIAGVFILATVIRIYIFLVVSDVVHFFICLLASSLFLSLFTLSTQSVLQTIYLGVVEEVKVVKEKRWSQGMGCYFAAQWWHQELRKWLIFRLNKSFGSLIILISIRVTLAAVTTPKTRVT